MVSRPLCIYHDQFIPGVSAVVRAIHGALAVAQLNHRGQLLKRTPAPADIIDRPSSIVAPNHPSCAEQTDRLEPAVRLLVDVAISF